MSVERWALKNIAIYGGTFDPVHHAHLILARDALETLGVDEVIFVPAAISPLKKAAPIANSESRLAMVRAAVKGESRFSVEDCELRRPPPSYTIDTVEELRGRNSDAAIYCLVGEDNVARLTKWHRFAELEKMVHFIVLDRTGQPPSHSYPVIERADPFAISYRQQWKKSSAARNFTWSNRNNPGKLSNNLRGTRLEQKGGRHRCAGFARHLDVYGFFRDLLRQLRASTESDRKRN